MVSKDKLNLILKSTGILKYKLLLNKSKKGKNGYLCVGGELRG